jgi:hypothetical protein
MTPAAHREAMVRSWPSTASRGSVLERIELERERPEL